MSYNTEQLALAVENLHFRYVNNPFEEESLENLENLRNTNSLEEIPISWVEAWATNARRGALRQYIQRDNAGRYVKLIKILREERAREELNSARRHRVVHWELREEEKREALGESNTEFRVREEEEEDLIEFED